MSDISGSSARRRQHKNSQIDELVTAVLTASRVLLAISAASLAELEDTITPAQFRTMVVLHTRGASNLSGLADALGVNSSTAMRTVDKLLAAGLLTRRDNPASRREVVIELSAAGTELAREVTDRRRAEIAGIVRRMPAAQRDDLIRALEAFVDAAGEPHASGTAAAIGW